MPTNALNSVPFLSAIRTAAQNIPGMNMIMNQTKLLSLISGCNPNGKLIYTTVIACGERNMTTDQF